MTTIGWIQILLFAIVIFAVTKPIGIYMFRIFEGDRQPLPRFFGPIERWIYKLGNDFQAVRLAEAQI
jgi:K+-transporting ATPase ATPase A chain